MPSSPKDVVIITQTDDPTVDHLLPALKRHGMTWAVVDTGHIPLKAGASMALGENGWTNVEIATTHGDRLSFNDVGAIWYRRPTLSHAPHLDAYNALGRFIESETRWFLNGWWDAVNRPIVNHPFIGAWASVKPRQLAVAQALGLTVPATVMGNDPDAVRSLWEQTQGNMVVKGFHQGALTPKLSEDKHLMLYTTPVTAEDMADDASIKGCPSIYQARVPKKVEIRAMVFPDHVLACEIHSQVSEKTREDWRNYDLANTPHAAHTLPLEIERALIEMLRRLDIHYGAADLIVTPDDDYVFLEINPFGNWAWVEDLTGLPISDAHCTLFKQLADR